jgi:hypothetical protein
MFEGPSALDLMAEFKRKHMALVERRIAEIRVMFDEHGDKAPTLEMSRAYDELDSIRYFEGELHRMIAAFVNDALKPWQRAFTDAVSMSASPLHIFKHEEKPL